LQDKELLNKNIEIQQNQMDFFELENKMEYLVNNQNNENKIHIDKIIYEYKVKNKTKHVIKI